MNRTYGLRRKIKTCVGSMVLPCLLCSIYVSWPPCTVCLCVYLLYHWHLTLQPLALRLALSHPITYSVSISPPSSLQAQLYSLIKVLLWLASGMSYTCSLFSVWWDQEEGQREGCKLAMCLLGFFPPLHGLCLYQHNLLCARQSLAYTWR